MYIHILEFEPVLLTSTVKCFVSIGQNTLPSFSDSSSVEILDSTRIHPETYAWATKMAEDAVEYDDEVS